MLFLLITFDVTILSIEKINMIFKYLDEFDKSSGTTRTCEQSVAVNKCEGACASSLRPSALNANGFQKVLTKLIAKNYQYKHEKI